MSTMNLLSLIDDILLAILAHCEVRDILSLRQTCKQLERLTHVRAVWLVACENYVLKRRLPFFSNDLRLDGLESEELERRTCLALRIAKTWTGSISRSFSEAGGHPKPSKAFSFDANSSGNSISELRFCPVWKDGHVEEWLLTVAKGIWSEISCWDLSGFRDSDWRAKLAGKWTRKGGLIRDVVVNKDFSSEACLAVSLTLRDSHRIEILGLRREDDDASTVTFDTLAVFESLHRVITLDGDFCATSNDTTEVHILNWRTKCFGVLKYDDPAFADTIPARCLQVAFAHECIVVGFARSISLYPALRLSSSNGTSSADESIAVCNYYEALATCKIDWTDCMSIVVPPSYPLDLAEGSTVQDPYPPVLILLRAECDDPWMSNVHIIMHYKLHPDRRSPASEQQRSVGASALELKHLTDLNRTSNPRKTGSDSEDAPPILPYEYPPALSAYMSYHRGFLRCPDLALGPCGTALWVHPRTRSSTGLVMEDTLPPSPDDSHTAEEWLCGTVLPTSTTSLNGKESSRKAQALNQSGAAHRIWTNHSAGGEVTWTSMDYVESLGWIGLGGSDGSVTLLRMVDV